MESKFTPGPWRSSPQGEGSRGIVCHVEGPAFGGTVCEFATEADARLIAAAPDLYAACKYALNDPASAMTSEKLLAALAIAEGK